MTTTDTLLIELRRRGYHPEIFAGEGNRHAWLAKIRSGKEFGGDSPLDALTALMVHVDRTSPPTTSQLRKGQT